MEAELTQTEPDLRKVVTDARTRFNKAQALVQANTDSRLALYDGMTTEQKQTVCAAIEKHLERVALLQQLALQLLGNFN
jgi:predicted outer membrane protein